jgi:hypothetical protein
MKLKEFVRENGDEIDAAINSVMYRYDGRGGRGTVPTPAPRYSNDERREWVRNDEGLYCWARREGVRI